MKKCILCNSMLKRYEEKNEGVLIRGWKCAKCGETFFPSSEMLRWEVLTGRRKNARKIGGIGNSLAVRLPQALVKSLGIRPGDYASFEKMKDNSLLIKIIHAKAT